MVVEDKPANRFAGMVRKVLAARATGLKRMLAVPYQKLNAGR